MLKKLVAFLGLGIAVGTNAHAVSYSPYKDEAANTIYNLLFCDDLARYKAKHRGPIDGPWKVLFADPKDVKALQVLASNSSEESRVRILAFNALGKKTASTLRKELLGVIIEVGLDGGLDTIAAYRDSGARYINQSGKMLFWEANDAKVEEKIKRLFSASDKVVGKIGPWDKSRLPPPTKGHMRMTFLVSDGLYFGQGPMAVLERDPLGGSVVASGTELLVELTNRAATK
jgi:hypothetical protein